eukprot:9151491-Karenia_brevis.AAC.1
MGSFQHNGLVDMVFASRHLWQMHGQILQLRQELKRVRHCGIHYKYQKLAQCPSPNSKSIFSMTGS